MQKLISAFSIAALLMLAGCQNASYMLDTYSKPGKVVFNSSIGTWWVFDRKDIGKLMTSPTPTSMIGPSIVNGVTMGLADVDPTSFAHQKVAREFLASTGRKCEIRMTTVLWRPNYEHTYTCR